MQTEMLEQGSEGERRVIEPAIAFIAEIRDLAGRPGGHSFGGGRPAPRCPRRIGYRESLIGPASAYNGERPRAASCGGGPMRARLDRPPGMGRRPSPVDCRIAGLDQTSSARGLPGLCRLCTHGRAASSTKKMSASGSEPAGAAPGAKEATPKSPRGRNQESPSRSSPPKRPCISVNPVLRPSGTWLGWPRNTKRPAPRPVPFISNVPSHRGS